MAWCPLLSAKPAKTGQFGCTNNRFNGPITKTYLPDFHASPAIADMKWAIVNAGSCFAMALDGASIGLSMRWPKHSAKK
jgi:hypothetical protein